MDSPRAVFKRQPGQLAVNRLLEDGQWQYQAPAYPTGLWEIKRRRHVKFEEMRYFIGLLASAALLFASGELSGRRAPGFSLPDLQGQQHDLQDYRGKIVIVDIIQTTCPHCQRLADVLEKVHAKYSGKVAVLTFAIPRDTAATVTQFVAEHKVSTPVLFDCGQAAASYLKATPQNPTVNVPHLFLIDGQGMIRNDFGYDFDTRNIFEGDGLDTEIDRLLAGPAPAKAKK
jgi:peroxiredoxin